MGSADGGRAFAPKSYQMRAIDPVRDSQGRIDVEKSLAVYRRYLNRRPWILWRRRALAVQREFLQYARDENF